jgi:hypothetical protein
VSRTCFACQHSIGSDPTTGEKLIREQQYQRGPVLYPVEVRPVCVKHRVAFSEPCKDYAEVTL